MKSRVIVSLPRLVRRLSPHSLLRVRRAARNTGKSVSEVLVMIIESPVETRVEKYF